MGQKVHPSIFRANLFPKYKNKWVFSKTKYNIYKIYLQIYLYLNKNKLKQYFNIQIVNETQLEIKCYYFPMNLNNIYKVENIGNFNLKEYYFELDKFIYIRKFFQIKYFLHLELKITPILLTLYYFSPIFLTNFIKYQLIEKKQKLKKVFKQIYILFLKQNILLYSKLNLKGIKISISGKLHGVQRAYSEFLHFGNSSLLCINNYIKYNNSFFVTPFGVLNIKVWVFYY